MDTPILCIRPHPLPVVERPVETGPRSPGTCPRPAAAASDRRFYEIGITDEWG